MTFAPLDDTVEQLRVLVDPVLLGDVDAKLQLRCGDEVVAMHLRHGVVVPCEDRSDAGLEVQCSKEVLGGILTGSVRVSDALGAAELELQGDATLLAILLKALDTAA